MPSLGDLFGKGSIIEQVFVWGVVNQVIGALASPYFDELTQDVNSKHPVAVRSPVDLTDLVVRGFINRADAEAEAARSGVDTAKFAQLLDAAKPYLAPADLAQLVVRNFITMQAAEQEAAFSGVDPDRFGLLTKIAADAPAPGDLATGLRRGLLPEDAASEDTPSFAGGIREGRLGDKWIPLIKALAVQWPTPTDALDALLEGQIDDATARTLYERFGGDPQFFTMLFNTRGTAPTPVEALELVNRGIIPIEGTGPDAVSYHQAFLEGPWRNKWEPVFLALKDYVTPPRSVVAMIHSGVLTDAQAAAELAKSGLSPELSAVYIAEGHQRASAKSRDLTQTAIIDLYEAQVIAATDAHNLLTALGYSDDNATYILTLADLRRSIAAVNTAVSRVHTLYTGHKINRATAIGVLNALALPADQVSAVIGVWDLEAAVNIKPLTEAQIVDAWYLNIITQDEAMAELETIGYVPRDAWTLLSIKNKSPLPGKPAPGPATVGGL